MGQKGSSASAASKGYVGEASSVGFTGSIKRFSCHFFAQVYKEAATDQNVFVSPYSVCTCLSMVSTGAANKTLQEMLSVLAEEGKDGGGMKTLQSRAKQFRALQESLGSLEDVRVDVANAVVSHNSLKGGPEFPTFQKILSEDFQALFLNGGGATGMQTAVDQFVNTKTNGKIPELPLQLTELDRLVLLNCVYFKGVFESEFDASKTKQDGTFKGFKGKVPSKLMNKNDRMWYAENETFQAVVLPYKGHPKGQPPPMKGGMGEIYLLIALPKETGEKGLSDTVKSLVSGAMDTLELGKPEVHLVLPSFKLEWDGSLNECLKNMGIVQAFDSNAADFSTISGGADALFLSKVKHKTVVELNEKGTEAAAATAAVMKLRGAAPRREEPKEVIVDRPFAMAIVHHEASLPLFMGAIKTIPSPE
mmetsp:Transcript_45700/g.90003  ORF Transcript_45700/g.90003 Transcript_45700/m.90003 type:complete len:420 (-) Transcript_45700:772-2031(-)